MADRHSTGSVRPCKLPTEKTIKVGRTFYPYPKKQDRAVPWIQLKGLWLEQAGFRIDTPVRVRIMPGCLVLITEVAGG